MSEEGNPVIQDPAIKFLIGLMLFSVGLVIGLYVQYLNICGIRYQHEIYKSKTDAEIEVYKAALRRDK